MAEINQYRQELRNKIIDYAMAEFYKRGVKAVKMDEISSGLHVSKRTVYEIFGDKEELLLAGMKMQQAKELQLLEEFANTQARNVIDIISYVYKQQMRRNEQVGVVFYEEIHKIPRVVEFMREYHSKECEERSKFFATGVKEGLPWKKSCTVSFIALIRCRNFMIIMCLRLSGASVPSVDSWRWIGLWLVCKAAAPLGASSNLP